MNQTVTPPIGDTEVEIDGRRIDLKNMTTEEGLALYRMLTPEQQQRADEVAQFVRRYESAIDIDFPEGIDPVTGIRQYISALRDGSGYLLSTADSWMHQIDEEIGDELRASVPGAQGAQDFHAFFSNINRGADAAFDLLTLGPVRRATGIGSDQSVLADILSETSGAVGSPVSEERARAFGAAYVAAIAEHERRGSQDPTIVRETADVWDNISSHVKAAVMWVGNYVPLVPQVATFLFNGFDWDAAREHVETTLEETGGRFNSLQVHYLEAATETREVTANRVPARDMMVQAETVAGIDTEERVDMLTNGGIYQRQDGIRSAVAPYNGNAIEDAPLLDANGQAIGRGDRVEDSLSQLLPGNADGWSFGAPEVVGTVLTAGGIYHYRQPILNGGRSILNAGGRTVISGTRMVTAGATGIAEGGLQSAAAWGQRAGATAEQMAPIRNAGNTVGQGGRVATVLDDAATTVGGSRLGLQGTKIAAVGRVAGRVAVPVAAAVTAFDGINTIDALQEGDTRRAVGSGTAFATAMAGGAAGAIGGATFFGVGAIPGFVVGFMGGGIAALVTKPAAEHIYDRYNTPQDPTASTVTTRSLATADPQAEQRRLQQARLQADGVNLAASGGVTTDGPNGAPILGGAPLQTIRLATI